MSNCSWRDDSGAECPRQAHGDGQLCLWHNPRVDKRAAYVIPLFEQELLLRNSHAAGFELSGLRWPTAELPGVILREAVLCDAILHDADLSGADLSDADLSRANLSGANLRGANLRGANLRGTHLGSADLRDADLREATLDGTILMGCDLRGADLREARLEHFLWNRFTRFSGIKGFEPPRISGDSLNDVTVPFASALAAGRQLECSPELLSSLGPLDPDLLRSRSYTNPMRQRQSTPDAGNPALEPRRAEASGSSHLAMPTPTPRPATALPAPRRRQPRLLLALLTLLSLWAVGVTVWATWSALQQPQIITGMPSPVEPAPEIRPPSIIDDGRYLEEIQRREERINDLRNHLAALTQQLEERELRRQQTQAEMRRLRDAADENVSLHEQLAEQRREMRRLGEHNRQLEDTARILAVGNEGLVRDNDTLRAQVEQRFGELEEVSRFAMERDRAVAQVEELEAQLAQRSQERDRLREELQRSQSNLERFLTRLEGSPLESLLSGDADRSPMLAIVPGRALTFSGDDLLLTLRVEEGSQPGRIRVQAVMQRSGNRSLPDLSLVLYGEQGQALRRMNFSFPAAIPGSPFVTTITEVDSPSFPTNVRVSAAQNMDNHLISNR
ncbi:MAG: hypothetical protein EA402_10530 [Planctomycetota bacterium]|nr:MAG: hypothetical protein EA402_10530 [Planctomycetota bacterium]